MAEDSRLTDADSDAKTRPACRKGCSVYGVVLLLSIGACGLPFYGILFGYPLARRRIENADHQEVLAACRLMISKKADYERFVGESGERVTVDFPCEGDTLTPQIIRDLKPGYAVIDSSSVLLVFFGGHVHLGLRGYAEGAEEHGSKKLCDGLWLIHD